MSEIEITSKPFLEEDDKPISYMQSELKECAICFKMFQSTINTLTCSPDCNRIRRKLWLRKYYLIHKKRNRELQKKWRKEHPELVRKQRRKYYVRHRTKVIKKVRRYQKMKKYMDKLGLLNDAGQKYTKKYKELYKRITKMLLEGRTIEQQKP